MLPEADLDVPWPYEPLTMMTDGAVADGAKKAQPLDALFDLFTRTRAIRRSIVEQGQDDAAPDFGRAHD